MRMGLRLGTVFEVLPLLASSILQMGNEDKRLEPNWAEFGAAAERQLE